MQDKPVVRLGNEVLGDILDEGELRLERCLGIGRQPDAVGYTEDVCIDCHRRAVIDDRSDYVGCLAPDTWELHQLLALLRDFSLIVSDEALSHSYKVTSLSAGIANAPYELKDVVHLSSCHNFGCRILAEEAWSDHIHPLVRALG